MPVQGTGLSLTGIRGEFFNALGQAQTYWQDLCTRIPSTTETERYRFLGAVPQVREWGQGRLAKGIRSESYDVTNQKYEATIEVDRDEIDDDQLGQIRLRLGELAATAAFHKDYLIEQLLLNGESAGFNSYDGVPFFNAAHQSGASGAQSNLLTYNATDADNPTAAEFRMGMRQAIAKMVAYTDDVGQPRRIMPNPAGFVAVVPPTMMFTALEALDMALVTNVESVFKVNVIQAAARVIALPGLTDVSKWYLLKTDVPIRPFILQDRMPLEFTALENNSETGFKSEKFFYGVRARYAMTYGYWCYAICTDFT